MDQQTRIKDAETTPNTYSLLIFDKGSKNMLEERQMVLENWAIHMQKATPQTEN